MTYLCVLPARAEAPVLVLDEVPPLDIRAGDKVLHAGQVQGEKVQPVQGEEIRPARPQSVSDHQIKLKVVT